MDKANSELNFTSSLPVGMLALFVEPWLSWCSRIILRAPSGQRAHEMQLPAVGSEPHLI